MAKEEYQPLSIRIKEATQKLKDAGFVVFNDDDTKFAILAERQRHICKNVTDFFKTTVKLTQENEN